MLTVGEPGDRYEQEADRVAEQVMRMPEPDAQPLQTAAAAVQRQADPETVQRLAAHRNPSLDDAVVVEEEAGKGAVQTLRPGGQDGGTEIVSEKLLSETQGERMEGGVRRFMETRFGADFNHVLVHTDARAAALSRSINARAFAYGRHIYFNEGEYQPGTYEGRRVLAHELTHVIQQGAARAAAPARRAEDAAQQVVEDRAPNGPPAIQRLGPLGQSLQHNVAPWGGIAPTGSNYEVRTDSGSTVTAWKGYLVFPLPHLYWCHGHSLDSFNNFGYSVYSGAPLRTVITDEWNNVPPDQTRAGDIAVWTAGFDHSAKFTAPVIENGQLVPDRSMLSTKNGQNALATMSLTDIAAIYGGNGIAVYRHR
ncbi:MAG TPA: DUF4157 domain-containing protein [Pyrinomonadaceae bacterium]|nr:DUF4157 domain-containing protein [Pyrinomonadaceae bacterium]